MSTPPILARRPPILQPISRTPAKPPILPPMSQRLANRKVVRTTVFKSTIVSTHQPRFKAKFKLDIEDMIGTDDDLISVTCTPECPEDEDDPITSFSDDEQPVQSVKPPKKKLKLVVVQSL